MKINFAHLLPASSASTAHVKAAAHPAGERTFAAQLSAHSVDDDAADEFDDEPTEKIAQLPAPRERSAVPAAEPGVAPTPTAIPLAASATEMSPQHPSHRVVDDKSDSKRVTTPTLPVGQPLAPPKFIDAKTVVSKPKAGTRSAPASVAATKGDSHPAATSTTEDETMPAQDSTGTALKGDAPAAIDVSAMAPIDDAITTTFSGVYSKLNAPRSTAPTPTDDKATIPVDTMPIKADVRAASAEPAAPAMPAPAAIVTAPAPGAPAPAATAPAPVEHDPTTRGHLDTGHHRAEITVGEGADQVTVRIAATHHTVRVEAVAASPEVQSALHDNRSELRAQLAKHGLDLDFAGGASPQNERDAHAAPRTKSTTATSSTATTATATSTAPAGVRVVA